MRALSCSIYSLTCVILVSDSRITHALDLYGVCSKSRHG